MPLDLNPDIYRGVLESLPIGVYLTDLRRQIAFWNGGAERITGYLGQEVIGRYCHDNLLMHCDENQVSLCAAACPLAQTMQDGKVREARIFLRHKQGQRVPVRVHAVPIRDEIGAIIGAAELFEERFRSVDLRNTRLRGDVTFDDQTEVLDRKAIESGIAGALGQREGDTGSKCGIILVGIDAVNHLRHIGGWQAVKTASYAVAQTLMAGTRPEDLVGCWSDERFAAVVACAGTEWLSACAERLKRLISSAAILWWGDRLSVTVSMGGTMARAEDTVESLVERAETALTAAAALGASSVLVV